VDLAAAKTQYEQRSQKASEIARQLAFAGIAFVWVFSGGNTSTGVRIHIPSDLLRVGLVLVAALTLDLLQYVWGAGSWGVFRRVHEKRIRKGTEADDFLAPPIMNWPAIGCFWLKLSAVSAAYVFLGIALKDRLY
jgi:hypothetical protein